MVLKAEIHCHIEGAAGPELVAMQAGKYGADVSAIIRDGSYVWSDFTSFLHAYDLASMLFRCEDDYALLAETYLSDLAAQGAIYSEFFISTDHAINAGLTPDAYISGLAEGIRRARDRHGIEARMIATGLRHEGPQGVERAARYIAANPHPLVTGFGMAGDERMYQPKDFAKAFDIARDAGLSITVHAGELCGAESVRGALDHLGPARIGHGVRAVEDPALVKRLADEGIVLEVCPGSNIAIGVFRSYAEHPFPRLRAAGVKLTLSSDDPPFFHTSLAQEYETARRHFGLDAAGLLEATRTAIEAAFVDGETRARLLARLG
ncbi:MAG: adenosine deaminase [Oricola sp.]